MSEFARQPIWQRQPTEPERSYAAFWAWVESDGAKTKRAVCDAMSVSILHCGVWGWDERADAYWTECQESINAGIRHRLERLALQSVDAAIELTQRQVVTEKHVHDTIKGVETKDIEKTLLPNALVVTTVLKHLYDAKNVAKPNNGDLSALLEAMVQDGSAGSQPSDPTPNAQQPVPVQRESGGPSELQDGEGEA